MKHLFIVNPAAGGSDKTAEVRAKVEKAFRDREDPFEIYVTRGPMDAARKIRTEAGLGEPVRVYACGGDGTFNECVCGAAEQENVAVCPFPTGTGNDFCRMFGAEKDCFRDLDALLDGWEHPMDLIECNGRYSANICSVGIDARVGCSVHKYGRLGAFGYVVSLLDGTVTPIDLIDCNGRWSANICSVGIDARVGTEVHKYGSIPFLGKASAYVVSAAVNMFKGISSDMTIACDGFERSEKTTLVCACNGRYYGGGFNPSLHARPDDGIMDIYIVKKVNLLEFAVLIGQYAAGKADELPKYVTHLRSSGALEMTFGRTEVINVDGEAMSADHVVMRMVPKALNLIVPKGMRFFEDKSL